MKPLIDRVHAAGGSNFTVNYLIFMVVTVIGICIIGLLALAGYEAVVKNQAPEPWIITTLGTLVGVIATLLVTNHTSQTVSSVQTQTVKEQQALSKPVVDAAAESAVVNAQTIQAVLQAMAVINQIHAQSTSDTATALATQTATNSSTAQEATKSIQDNTKATQENTIQVQKENSLHDSN